MESNFVKSNSDNDWVFLYWDDWQTENTLKPIIKKVKKRYIEHIIINDINHAITYYSIE